MKGNEAAAPRTVNNKNFNPPFYLKNPVLQTILSSLKINNKKTEVFDNISEEIIIPAGENIRLSGYYSGYDNKEQTGEKRGKLLILLHGWEGSEKSSYMVKTGRFFYRKGFSIFRLNMRDHGNSHHLNEGLFYGTLIDEAFAAVKNIAERFGKEKDIYIAGFSMGGNFALRIAGLAGMDNDLSVSLKRVIAVNPPLNPWTATANIDKYFIIRKYFLRKWQRSLLKKEKIFPSLYSFSKLPVSGGCMRLTEILLERYSEYKGLEDYFSRYTLKKDFFSKIRIPVFIITAEDDPIIDPADFREVAEAGNRFIELNMEKHGGHCAYIKNMKLDTWLLDEIAEKAIINI